MLFRVVLIISFALMAGTQAQAAGNLKWKKPEGTPIQASVKGFDCSKRYCKRMKSCAEACYKLSCSSCGLNVWTKPSAKLICADCDKSLEEN